MKARQKKKKVAIFFSAPEIYLPVCVLQEELRMAKIQLELCPEEDMEARAKDRERELSVSSGDEPTVTFIKNIWGHWT